MPSRPCNRSSYAFFLFDFVTGHSEQFPYTHLDKATFEEIFESESEIKINNLVRDITGLSVNENYENLDFIDYGDGELTPINSLNKICWQERILWNLVEDDALNFSKLCNDVSFYNCLISIEKKMKKSVIEGIKNLKDS